MTTQPTSRELLTPGEIRAALNAYDAEMARREAGMARRASVEAAEGLGGDGLAPARGVCLGALLGALLWCLVGAAWCAAAGR